MDENDPRSSIFPPLGPREVREPLRAALMSRVGSATLEEPRDHSQEAWALGPAMRTGPQLLLLDKEKFHPESLEGLFQL